jgi:hypothetical protein
VPQCQCTDTDYFVPSVHRLGLAPYPRSASRHIPINTHHNTHTEMNVSRQKTAHENLSHNTASSVNIHVLFCLVDVLSFDY